MNLLCEPVVSKLLFGDYNFCIAQDEVFLKYSVLQLFYRMGFIGMWYIFRKILLFTESRYCSEVLKFLEHGMLLEHGTVKTLLYFTRL